MRVQQTGGIFSQQQQCTHSIWNKDKVRLKTKELKNLSASPAYFSKRTKTFKRLVKRFYYIDTNSIYYSEKQKSTFVKGALQLKNVYAEFYESKVNILKQPTFIIKLTHNFSSVELLTENVHLFEEWKSALRKQCIMLDFNLQFSICKMIGKGGFARVFQAQDNFTKEYVAIKVISKEQLLQQSKGIKSLMNEIEIMKDLRNVAGCLKLLGIYETDSSVNLVLEYIKGGELMKRITNNSKDNYTIDDARQLMNNILKTLSQIHQKNIIHRDLKPDNILMEDGFNQTTIKIADYGLATYDSSVISDFLFKKCGTPGFLAPEVISNKESFKLYDQKVDIFSAGVIFYILLCGKQPFKGDNYQQVVRANKAGQIDFTEIDKSTKIPQAGKSLLKQMLSKDPKSRPSAIDCLNSFFFKDILNDSALNLEFSTYEFNRQYSKFGLNQIKINSIERASQQSNNEIYWINPVWKGQTNTLQTITKLSSTYIQANEALEVRKRNKSNFAPNTSNIDQDDSNVNSSQLQVREKRSASADCDNRQKYHFNQSLHITVLKKSRMGDGDDSQGSSKTISPNNSVSPRKGSHLFFSQNKEILKKSCSQEYEYSKVLSHNQNSAKLITSNYFNDNVSEVYLKKISMTSTAKNNNEMSTIFEDKDFDNVDKIKSIAISMVSKTADKYLKNNEDRIENTHSSLSEWLPPLEEELFPIQDIHLRKMKEKIGGSSLKISEAIENKCQKINQTVVRCRDKQQMSIWHSHSVGKTEQVQPCSAFLENSSKLENISPTKCTNNYHKSCLQSKAISSSQDVDFRVSDVEENITQINHNNDIHRSLIFRYNPFCQQFSVQHSA